MKNKEKHKHTPTYPHTHTHTDKTEKIANENSKRTWFQPNIK